jgi:hypothetical protein
LILRRESLLSISAPYATDRSLPIYMKT